MKREKTLVCISGSPSNARIIRTAAQIAGPGEGELIALYVESPGDTAFKEADSRRLEANMQLAASLGARCETVYGEDVALRIAEYARLAEADRIVIGQSVEAPLRRFFRPALTEQLASLVPEISLLIIPDVTANVRYHERVSPEQKRKRGRDLVCSLLLLSGASACGMLFQRAGLQEANIITLYILAVTLASVISGSWPVGALNAAASVFLFNFLFTRPYFYFRVYDAGYMVTFAVMFIAAFITGTLASRLREYAEQSAKKAYRTQILLDASQLLQQVSGEKSILLAAGEQIRKLTGRCVLIYPVRDGRPGEPITLPGETGDAGPGSDYPAAPAQPLTRRDRECLALVQESHKEAGAWTEHCTDAGFLYIPAGIYEEMCGIFAVERGEKQLGAFVHSVIVSILAECALAVANDRNARAKEEAAVAAHNEQLRSNLLRSVSHDLRTPLTSISGNASNLLSSGAEMSEETKTRIYQDIREDAGWLINVVENLLAVTRLENGQVNLNLSVELINEVIEEALVHADRDIRRHKVVKILSDRYLFVQVDAKLIAQVIVNLVNNAVKYTPEGSQITIRSGQEGSNVIVSVSDDGPGVEPGMMEHLFEMFYTGDQRAADSRRGVGLGLSLCRSVVEAHGGRIWAEQVRPSGLKVCFTLPGKEVELHGLTEDPDRGG